MEVQLISYTPDALELLLFTKQTRLDMSKDAMDEIKSWPEQKKLDQLNYMLHTIQSSWEFVDYTFVVRAVPRSTTHQMVRTRTASYAQQSQRLEQDAPTFTNPFDERSTQWHDFDAMLTTAVNNYKMLLQMGANAQDAREILPNAANSNIVVKMNLRTMHDLMLKRLCVRTQGMYQDIAREMRKAVIAVHPWAEQFLRVWCAFHGTCQFHNHPMEKCPVKPYVYNPHTGEAYAGGWPAPIGNIQKAWEQNRAEPQPVKPQAH